MKEDIKTYLKFLHKSVSREFLSHAPKQRN